MKLEAASTVPGFANSSQNGTEPSAKSIQTGFLAGSEQASWPQPQAPRDVPRLW